MGWSGGSEIFDPVARALIDSGADEQTKRHVLGTLIGKLQDDDWDTEDESLQEFHHDPVIVQIFYEHGVGNVISGYAIPEGVIGYDGQSSEWTLTCSDGPDACGELARGDGSSLQEHDRLVRLWVDHESQRHGGNGKVPTRMLADR